VDQKKADYIRSKMRIKCMGELVFKKPHDKSNILETIGLQGKDFQKADEFLKGLPAIKCKFGIGTEDTENDFVTIPGFKIKKK
jgi:hypothetical protein